MLEELYQPCDQMKQLHLSQEKGRFHPFMMLVVSPFIMNQNQRMFVIMFMVLFYSTCKVCHLWRTVNLSLTSLPSSVLKFNLTHCEASFSLCRQQVLLPNQIRTISPHLNQIWVDLTVCEDRKLSCFTLMINARFGFHQWDVWRFGLCWTHGVTLIMVVWC